MKQPSQAADKINTVCLLLAASVSGLCNSLIGAGGGILMSISLSKLFSHKFNDKRDIYVNSQASMIPGCALSCAIYYARGMLDTAGFSILAIPAAVGGAIGSFLVSKIKSEWIQILFSLLVIWSGIRMISS